MRIPDRVPWLRLVVAFAYVLAALLFLYWYIIYIQSYDLRHPAITVPDFILAAFIVCALLTLALHAVLAAWLELRRNTRRAAAIAGDQEALPLARNAMVEMDPGTPRVVDAVDPYLKRHIIGQLITLALLLGFVIIFGDLLLTLILLPFDIHVLLPFLIPDSPPRLTANPIRYPYMAGFEFAGGLAIGAVRSLFAEIAALPIKAARMQVSEDGIMRASLWGGRRFLAWDDARLLELSSHRYSLYGGNIILRWEHPTARSDAFSDPFGQIAPAVRLHTGLLPRTVDPGIVAPGASLSLARLDRAVARLPWWLFFAAMAVTIAAVAPVDQTLLVGGLVCVCIGVLGWWFSTAGKRLSTRKQYSTSHLASTAEDPPLSSGAVYEMTVGSYHAFVFNQVMFVILGMCAIGFSLSILGALFAQFVLHVPGLHLHPLPPTLLLLLVSITILGVVTIIVSVRAKDTILLADATGLRKRWLMGSTFLAWGEMDRIERRRIYGVLGYVVHGKSGSTRIVWPRSYFVPSRRAQEQGAILTDPDGMAALVARQIGQLLEDH